MKIQGSKYILTYGVIIYTYGQENSMSRVFTLHLHPRKSGHYTVSKIVHGKSYSIIELPIAEIPLFVKLHYQKLIACIIFIFTSAWF
jgi:hypothetical protein